MRMEHLQCHFKFLNRDILADIMVRLDGSTLASAACTCSDLRDMARHQSLWKQLCHSTWPSTSLKEAQHLISSSPVHGFDRFYADSYPLIVSADKISNNIPMAMQTHISPSNFVSFIDVYYGDQCILSSVIDGVQRAADSCVDDETSDDRMRWLLNCPFKMVLLDVDRDEANNEYADNNYDQISAPHFTRVKLGQSRDHCKELVEGLRLSWVLLDKERGRAVNLSSWKPMSVKKIWAIDGDYVIHFGCIIPVEESLLPHKLAKCLILARCNLAENDGCLRWKEISMHFEDTAGAYINGSKSLAIMSRALYCFRSNKRLAFEKDYQRFEEGRQNMMRIKKLKENIADWLCLISEVAIFITLGYYIFTHFKFHHQDKA